MYLSSVILSVDCTSWDDDETLIIIAPCVYTSYSYTPYTPLFILSVCLSKPFQFDLRLYCTFLYCDAGDCSLRLSDDLYVHYGF